MDSSAPELFASFGVSQLFDIPTRMTQTTTAPIDLLFVSNVDSIQSHGCLPNIADHEGIFVSFHSTQQKVSVQTRSAYDYKNIDEKNLIQYLNQIDYESLVFSLPVCDQAEAYSHILIQAREKFVPTKTIVIRPCD